MPWYKIFCNSGPGHQSYHEFFHWEDTPFTNKQKKDFWEDAFHDRDYPIGKVVLLKALPADIRKFKIQQYERQRVDIVKRCDKLLSILRETPVKGCNHLHTIEVKNIPVGHLPTRKCVSCNKVKIYGYKNWVNEPKNLERATSYDTLKKFNERKKRVHTNK